MPEHLMESLAYHKLRPATIESREHEGVREFTWVDKGTFIQLVSDELLAQEKALLFVGRWHRLERNHNQRMTWVIRNVWFWRLIVAAWRLSLAAHYMRLGVSYGLQALRGREPL